MITLILKGGLGNQMLQYAFAKSLSIEKGEELRLNTTFLDTRLPVKDFTPRAYELDLFHISSEVKGFYKNKFLESKLGYLSLKILNAFNTEYIVEGPNPYEYRQEYIEQALRSSNPILEGYFNNYRYFEKHNQEILEIFDTDKLADTKFAEIEKTIQQSNSVSINIRRGDYLNSKHKDVFINLQKDYYEKAIKHIREKTSKPVFFVFSYDDPEWIKQELKFSEKELVIVDKKYVGDRFKTYLRLISLCKNNIISNSTFAFWGAYLNKNKDKIVISPKKWMVEYEFENPRGWISIS